MWHLWQKHGTTLTYTCNNLNKSMWQLWQVQVTPPSPWLGKFPTFSENHIREYRGLVVWRIIRCFGFHDLEKNYQKNLKPEIRVYDKPETLTFETAIISNIRRDLYITMSNIDGSEFYNVKFQIKPFMLWIWLTAFLTAGGSLIRIFLRKWK